ncbi:MAG: chaperone NapD [Planctomycetales bacterium]|nr:chaperone NapD [Planctomycetales bacterium]
MPLLFGEASAVPISGLIVTFQSSVAEHSNTIAVLRKIPEIDIGESAGSKLAIVIDSETKRRDQEIWDTVQQLPGVIDLAVAMVAFDEDHQAN